MEKFFKDLAKDEQFNFGAAVSVMMIQRKVRRNVPSSLHWQCGAPSTQRVLIVCMAPAHCGDPPHSHYALFSHQYPIPPALSAVAYPHARGPPAASQGVAGEPRSQRASEFSMACAKAAQTRTWFRRHPLIQP